MIFEQFHLPGLGHASYLLGCERSGQALVFDPRRDVDCYLAAARRHGLRIRYVMDSHGHNDYLSGLTELVARTGAGPLAPVDGQVGYPYRPLVDGELVELGDLAVQALATPGHTPEHTSLLAYDRSVSADEPALLLSGGALLVGDLARPDLLGGPAQAEESARVFCATIQHKILQLPDHVEVFPTHVAGSLCGGNIGSRLSTTVGYERRTNTILAGVEAKEEFVEHCLRLENLPAVPPYWRRMRAQNLAGVRRLGVLAEPPALPVVEFTLACAEGTVVLDTRSPEAFGVGHVPGAINVGAGSSFATWAGTVLAEGARVLLVVETPEQLWPVTWDLLRIGYAAPVGWLAGGMAAWRVAAEPLGRVPQITVQELRERRQTGEVNLLDVRQPAEWAGGHAPGAHFITGAELPDRVEEVPTDKPLAITCGSGYRSSVAASLLARTGQPVLNVLGGMTAWTAAGYPTIRDPAAAPGSEPDAMSSAAQPGAAEGGGCGRAAR